MNQGKLNQNHQKNRLQRAKEPDLQKLNASSMAFMQQRQIIRLNRPYKTIVKASLEREKATQKARAEGQKLMKVCMNPDKKSVNDSKRETMQ